jgi:tetratricopeptide (TPR) repeat protein
MNCRNMIAAAAWSVVLVVSAAPRAETISHSEEVLPIADVARGQLPLDSATAAELLAGAKSQLDYFLPAGAGTIVTSRPQLDALVTSTILLEEGLRRGAGSYEDARLLFHCYVVMFATGHSGALARMFRRLGDDGNNAALIDVYIETLDAFESYGGSAAMALGEVLRTVRPEDSEIAYLMAGVSEQSGDGEAAIRFYEAGVEAEIYPERLTMLAELQAASDEALGAATMDTAIRLAPTLADGRDAWSDRIERRQRFRQLLSRHGEGRADEDEQYELAQLYRATGQALEALAAFEALSDWRGAPDDFLEEYAITAMDANQPMLMAQILDPTRESDGVSPRLLQLRLVAESVRLVAAAAGGEQGFALADYLEGAGGEPMRVDLESYEVIDPDSARFVRVYLELITALVELRRSGSLETERITGLQEQIDELISSTPDEVSGYRFGIMLAIYTRDSDFLRTALAAYEAFCENAGQESDYRRAAAILQLQVAVNAGDLDLVDEVDDLVRDWPRSERGALYQLIRGTAVLVRSELGRGSESDREERRDAAGDAFREGAGTRPVPGSEAHATAADFAALYNNLAYLSLRERDIAAARLYIGAARRYLPDQPAVLMNLGVSMALALNMPEALVSFTLGAQQASADPAVAFQLVRWVGHIYSLSDRSSESIEAYRTALGLYDSQDQWTETIDDGVLPGGPIEWGLLYREEEGLVVTMGISSPPLFFLPAPVGVLEMAGAIE